MKTHSIRFLRGFKPTTLVLGLSALTAMAVSASVATIIIYGKQFYNGTMSNVVVEDNVLRLGNDTTPTTFNSGFKLFGVYTSGENEAKKPFQHLSLNVNAKAPQRSAVTYAFRTQAGGVWSTWHDVTTAELGKPLSVEGSATAWQYRLSLYANSVASSPEVRAVTVRLFSNGQPASEVRQFAEAAHPTYSIYATREGLVGNKTANGHVIASRDHFVALPSSTVLDCNGCSTYTVTLNYPKTGLSVTEKIYDVGPWNTKDNYWHTPRAEFTSLALGLPESQAAYQTGFNGGLDEFGRSVANPAGIDLADGTFWDSLGMTGNDWINVTFNMESSTTTYIVDDSDAGFTASANWIVASSATNKYGSSYHYRSTQSISDSANWNVGLGATKTTSTYCWYPQGANRSATAPYIVYYSGGSSTVNVNQQTTGGQWVSLGSFSMASGSNNVKLSCWTTTGFVVVADAIKWVQ